MTTTREERNMASVTKFRGDSISERMAVLRSDPRIGHAGIDWLESVSTAHTESHGMCSEILIFCSNSIVVTDERAINMDWWGTQGASSLEIDTTSETGHWYLYEKVPGNRRRKYFTEIKKKLERS